MIKIHQEVYGQGDPIVLIHGWAMHTGMWRKFAQQLAKHHRVICVDLPGHGLSENVEPYTLEQISLALINKLPESFCLLGWSLGATVALTITKNYPHRVNSLILLAGNPRFIQEGDWSGIRAEVLKDFAKNLSTNCRSTLIRFFSLQVMGLADGKNILVELKKAMQECDEPEQMVLQGGLDILMDVDLREYLTSASCPVKIIQGDKDSLVPIKVVSDIQGILPTCEFDIIRGAGHVPFISHQMEVIGAINSFL